MQRCVAEHVFLIARTQKDMRLPSLKGNRRAAGRIAGDFRMARKGNMRREGAFVRRKPSLMQRTDEPFVQRIERRFAFHAQDQDAVFPSAKVRKAIQGKHGRREIRRAARKHIARICKALLGHLAQKGQRNMMVLMQGIASGNALFSFCSACCSCRAHIVRQ